jgi:hypothetical protein
MHQQHVHHRRFVDNKQIAVERILVILPKTLFLRINFEQAVNRFGLKAGSFVHPLGRAAGGGTQQEPYMLGRENAQDGVDDRGLADARSAGNHQNLRSKRQPDRRFLTFGERQVDPLLKSATTTPLR